MKIYAGMYKLIKLMQQHGKNATFAELQKAGVYNGN